MIAVWASLGFMLAATAAGVAFAARRGLALWRALRSLLRATGEGTASLAEATVRLGERAAGLAEGGAELQRAVASLQASLERWRILAAAFGDVRASVDRVLAIVVPRK